MSKRKVKHKFVHPDPEDVPAQKKKNIKSKTNKKRALFQDNNIVLDLKKSVITILVFILILVIFYFTDSKFSFLDQIKTLIN